MKEKSWSIKCWFKKTIFVTPQWVRIRVGNSLIGFLSDSMVFCEPKSNLHVKMSKLLLLLFFHERPEWITHCRSFVKSNGSKWLTVALLFRSTWVIRSRSLFKKERLSKERREQFFLWLETIKNIQKIRFLSNYFAQIACFWAIRSGCFCHERPDRIAYSCSFVRSNLSDLLMVALLSWATWVNRSRSLFDLSNFEWKRKSKRAKEQIPNPGLNHEKKVEVENLVTHSL